MGTGRSCDVEPVSRLTIDWPSCGPSTLPTHPLSASAHTAANQGPSVTGRLPVGAAPGRTDLRVGTLVARRCRPSDRPTRDTESSPTRDPPHTSAGPGEGEFAHAPQG